MGWNVALLLAWLAWAAPTAGWLVRGWLADADGHAQAVLALVAAALLVRDAHPAAIRARLARPPAARALPLLLALGGPIAAAVGPDLDTLRAVAVLGSAYGLAGLFLTPDRWARLAPAPLLGLAVLPIAPMVDAILGWPLRKGIAAAAATALGGMPLDAVIAIEGSVTHVDAPCAGVRSLWAGAALILLWALRNQVRPGPRLALALGLGGAVAVLANLGRVVAIVGLSSVLGWPLLADTVHQPLGVVGFALALGLAVLALPGPEEPRPEPVLVGSPWVAPVLVLAIGLAAVQAPRGPAEPAAPLPRPALPAGFVEVAPSRGERAFADERGATLVKGTLDGASVALVESRSWLAHHVPTRCLESAGWTPGVDELAVIGGREVRAVALTRGAERATAIWWFQSGDRVTDDLVVRIRDGWATGRPWTLVSVLVPDGVDPGPALADLRGVSW